MTSLGSIGRINYLADTNNNSPATEPAHHFYTGTGDTDTAISLMTILTNGNVGIGRTDPTTPFNVFTPSVVNIAKFENNTTGIQVTIGDSSNTLYSNTVWTTNSGTGEVFKQGSANTSWGGASSLNIYNSNGVIAFHPNGTANAMFIATSGNVGIGTTNPATKLHVPDGEISTEVFSFSAINGITPVNTVYLAAPRGSNAAIFTSNTERLTVNGSGNVGIGTTNPLSKLHVNGDIRASLSNVNQTNFVAYNTSTGLFTYADTGSIVIGTATNADNVYINDDATDANQPVLFAEFVNEYQPVRGNNNFNYNPATDTLTAGTYVESSALKFKENVIHLTGSLQDVEKLQGVTYNKIGQTRKEIGLIADEVVKVLPELVKYQDGEVYGLSYNRLTAVLVEAVKELSDKVKQQEIFIQDLADRLKKLEDKG
jgi:hypothetical protein